jgi:hypothetical protein
MRVPLLGEDRAPEHVNRKKTSNRISRFIRFSGLLLFALSFFMPDIERGATGVIWTSNGSGFHTFLNTPLFAIYLLSPEWKNLVLVLLVTAAWCTNFTVFLLIPKDAAWLPMIIPWMLFFALWLFIGPFLTRYLPFYFWGFGLGLFHLAVYFEKDRKWR